MVDSLSFLAWFNGKKGLKSQDFYREIIGGDDLECDQISLELSESTRNISVDTKHLPNQVGLDWKEQLKISIFSKIYIFRIIQLASIGATLFSILYGLSTNLSSLGIDNISITGVFFSCTAALGNLIILPIGHKIRRVFMVNTLQILLLIFAFVLLGLSFLPPSNQINNIQAIISVGPIAILQSMEFPFLFFMCAELFPTAIRGACTATVFILSRFMGNLAPILAKLS